MHPRATAGSGPRTAGPPVAVAPLFDRAGRFSLLKTIALVGSLLPAGFLAWQWEAGDLGAQPILAASDVTGLWTIRFTLIALVIRPVCRLARQPKIALTRRIVGVSAMGYGLAHLLLYTLDQKFR